MLGEVLVHCWCLTDLLGGLHTFIVHIEFNGLTGKCKRGNGQAQGYKACRTHDERELSSMCGRVGQAENPRKRPEKENSCVVWCC